MKNNSPELNLRVGRDQINGTHHPQEDSYDCGETPYGYFYVLADGMGGYGGGDIASQTVVEAFAASMAKGDSLDEALVVANKALAKVKKRKNLPQGAGCTLVAVTVDLSKDGVSCSFLSVGDSYIYYCPAGAFMQQVNPLHENEDGSLYSALQGGEIEAVFTAVNALQLYPGDRLMLASDGVQAFGENKLRSLFRKYPVPPMQNQDADVIPGEAGDLVYRILHRLEEDTELGLRQDPEYYQDNASVMIVEWAPDSQEKPQQGRPVEVKLPFVLTRERGVMLGIIMCLVLALCFVLWPNSGNETKSEPPSKSISVTPSIAQTSSELPPAGNQDPVAEGSHDDEGSETETFKNLLKDEPDNYVAIVEAWVKLGNAQKQVKPEDIKTWFSGDAEDNKEKFDCLMKRCNGLLRVCAKDNKQLSDEQKKQVDSMLALLLQSDGTTIESPLSAEEINGKIEDNVLKIRQINVHIPIPHFRLLDLWLATKVKPDIVSKGEWLNWFIYKIDDPVNDSLKPKLEELQSEVRTKALKVEPDKLKDIYVDGKASKINVDALLGEVNFVEEYLNKDNRTEVEKVFVDGYEDELYKVFAVFIVKTYQDKGDKLLNLGLTQDTLDKLFPDKADEVVKSTAQKSLASATLDKKLDDLVTNPVAGKLAAVESAYDLATKKGVTDCDVKVSTKVAELITNDNFKNEIYKKDRYLKPIWRNLLTRLVSEKKKEAKSLSDLDLDVDKICNLLNKKNDNGDLKTDLKTALTTLINAEMEQQPKYDRFKALHGNAEKWLDPSFAKELVWQFFTTGEKLNATKVTEYAKDGRKAAALMDVLIEQLTEKKKGDGEAPIKVTDLMDYSQVVWVDYETGWGNGPVPDSWKLYRYILYMIPSGILGDIEKKERNAGKTVNAKKEENLQTLSGAINNSKYAGFKDRLTDQDKKTEN